MDNRINVKDIVLFLLILMVGGLIVLKMFVQDRRSWDVLQTTLTELKEQRESVDLYKRELAQMKRDQDALRGGVEKLIEVLQQSAAEGGGPRLGETASVELGGDRSSDDPTFYRVEGLREKDDFAEGDYFIDVFSATVKKLTPYIAGDLYASRIGGYVMETLVTVDPNSLEYKPWVAKSWTISEDGLTITYKMRKDVVFADGHPMDARDVVFSYEWVMNPKVDAPRTRSYFEKFESVKALDDYTVEFKYREPYFNAMAVTGLYLEILPEHWVKQFSTEEYNKMPGLLFGSGPYKMAKDPKQWQPGSGKIELVRNDNYWGPRPALDRVIWREVNDPTVQLTQLRNREIDRYAIRSSQYRDLSRDEQLRAGNNLHEFEYVSSGYSYVGWNQLKNGRSTPFSDKRVRQAMTLLIDRKSMASGIYDNLSSPATGPFHPLGWQADPNTDPWPYDPERAKKLLTEAGYIDRDGDGIRESEDGRQFTFDFIYSTGSTETRDVVLKIQASMRQAGIKMGLDPLDWPAMQQKLDDGNFDAIMLGWGGSIASDLYQMFHSSQTEDGGNNYYNHKSEVLDKVIDKARTTVDFEKGKALWNEAHRILYDEQPYTFMFTRKSILYVDKRVKNFEVTAIGPSFAWEYYVPGPMQLHSE